METQTHIQEKVRRNREVLQDLCLQVTGNIRLETLLNRIVTLIVESLKVRRASIMTLEEGRYLQIRASHGIGQKIVKTTRVPLGQGISGRVAAEGKPMAIRDVSDVQIIERDEEVNYKTKSFVCMPMLFSNKVKGVINVTDKLDGSPFDHMDMELLTTISGHTAVLLQNYQLYSKLRTTVDRLKSTNRKFATSTHRLESFINNATDAIVNVDSKGRIVMFNDAALQYFPNLIKRRSLFANMPNKGFGDALRRQLEETITGEATKRELDLEISPEHRVHFRVESTPSHLLTDEDFDEIHVMYRFVDVTFDRTMEERKQEFMALVSHELRTPITVLKSYFSILLGQMRSMFDEDILEMLDTMQSAVERLHREVGKVMIMSQLDRDDYQLDVEEFDYVQLMEEVRRNLLLDAEEKDVEIHCICSDEEVIVSADRRLVKLAAENLLKNAVQHSPDGETVRITCRLATLKSGDEGVHFEVVDKGLGLGPRDMERIMGRMEQVQHHMIRETGGLGLGLSIVRRAVELNCGEFFAQSSPGRGSRFGFMIPRIVKGEIQ